MKKRLLICVLFLCCFQWTYSQDESFLTLSEYLGYIKKYHPIVKQANLVITKGEAKLLKARGDFDPKVDVNYSSKNFKDSEYFNKLNATFKIPTWYGVSVEGKFEKNSGIYLGAESKVPKDGLYSIGISASLAKGLLTNKRMAMLKKAKLYKKQSKTDNQLLVNNILYKSIQVYFNWLKTYKEKQLYGAFLENAKMRFEGIKKGYELGEKATIDTTEARISYNNRKLNLEKANLNYTKALLELSNYLWIDNIPVEVKPIIFPDIQTVNQVDSILKIKLLRVEQTSLKTHPKLKSLEFKYDGLKIEKRLKMNNLLPKIDAKYNFLTQSPETFGTYNISNYKFGLSVGVPIFLRKSRADLKLTKYKLQAVAFEKQLVELTLKNKLNAVKQEITSYERQSLIVKDMVSDYSKLLAAEERKFELGESSLFLINSRETKLIQNSLKSIQIENILLNSKVKMFNVLGSRLD